MHDCDEKRKSLQRQTGMLKFFSVILVLIGLGAFFEAVGVAGPVDQGGVRIDFPKSTSLPYDKFGVFIGIGRYCFLPADAQLDGPCHDVTALKDIFRTTFGVKRFAMLTDEKATRQNIGQVLGELVEQVRQARQKSSGPISVVIAYAGHGSRVQRTEMGLRENPDSPDESTWVCADAKGSDAESGDKDFRASELFRIHAALSAMGAQVVMISDACYSGTGFRGSGKIRALRRSIVPVGPEDDLFPDLPALSGEVSGGTPEQMAAKTSNFAWYAACGNGQYAFEGPDSQGNRSGYFTAMLCDLLPRITPSTTYGELASQITARFSIEHPIQSPEFHAPAGKANERFFCGGFASPHAELVLPGYHIGDVTEHVKLNMGTLHGVAVGAKFTFYANSEDFEGRRNQLAEVMVGIDTDLQPLDCTLLLPAGVKLPPTAWAELDAERMNDVRVGIDGTVPAPLAAKLSDLDLKHRITLVRDVSKADLAVHFDDGEKVVGIYEAAQLPSLKVPLSDKTQPMALRGLLPFANAGDVDGVCKNLLYVIRVRRLVSLAHVGAGSELLKCDLQVRPVTGGPFNQADMALGVATLIEGQSLRLHFTNTRRPFAGDMGLYVSIFSIDVDGSIDLKYPEKGVNPAALKAGKEFDYPDSDPPLRATIDHSHPISDRGELTRVLVIATDRLVDFTSLVEPPEVTAINARGGGQVGGAKDPLLDLLGDTTNARGRVNSTWITRAVGILRAAQIIDRHWILKAWLATRESSKFVARTCWFMQTGSMSQVSDRAEGETIGELSKWTVQDRCEFILDEYADLLKQACSEGALHAQCKEAAFVRRLGWGIAFNTGGEKQGGVGETGRKPRTYSEIWPVETPWSQVWDGLTAFCDEGRGKLGSATFESVESERYLHHLARSISCERRDDWQPPEARPVDLKVAEAAFSKLFQLHKEFVLAVVKSKLRGEGRNEQDEVMNDVFMRTFKVYWRSDSRFRFIGRSKISTLLHGVARNACADFYRSKSKEPKQSNSLEFLPADAGPLSETEAAELRMAVKKCLRELKPKQALVYYLVHRRKTPQNELAKRLGVTPAAVNQWLKAAEAHVKSCLAGAK